VLKNQQHAMTMHLERPMPRLTGFVVTILALLGPEEQWRGFLPRHEAPPDDAQVQFPGLLSSAAGIPFVASGGSALVAAADSRPADVRDLIVAARGAPALICGLAASAVGNGWGWWGDAPATPLPRPDMALGHRRGEQLLAEDVQFLIVSLDTPDPCVREVAVRILARQRSEQVAKGLTDRLASGDSAIRVTAALGLGLHEPASAVDALIRALRDAVPGVRANAVWALGRIGDGRGVRPAMQVLDDRSDLVREAAAGALGRLDSTSAVPALTRILANDPEARVRRVAAWALAQLEARQSADALAQALQRDKDPGVREMCAWALGDLSERSVPEALLAAAQRDEDEKVRETAVWAVGQIGDGSAAERLGQMMESERSSTVRGTIAWALGQMDLSKAPKGLIAALADGDARLRLRAAWAISEIGDAQAIPALRAALAKEQDARARKAELRALIHSGERAERLTELLQSSDPAIREAVIRGLAGRNHSDPWPWPEPRPRPFP
jgi:HEAT repeat protein